MTKYFIIIGVLISALCLLLALQPVEYGTGKIIDKTFSGSATYNATGVNTKGDLSFTNIHKSDEYNVILETSKHGFLKCSASLQNYYKLTIGSDTPYSFHWYGCCIEK